MFTDRSSSNILTTSGFTLIELVVAIAILAIIVAIAVPSYTSQVLRSNRTEAIDELLRQAGFQQATYTRTNAFDAPATNPYTINSGRYTINTATAKRRSGLHIHGNTTRRADQRRLRCPDYQSSRAENRCWR